MVSPYNALTLKFEESMKRVAEEMAEFGFWPDKAERTQNGITTRWTGGKVFKFRRRAKT